MVLGEVISTKITFDGEHLKEKAIDENIASYKYVLNTQYNGLYPPFCRALLTLAIECGEDIFNIYVNGHLHDVFMNVGPGFDPQQYTMDTQTNKKNIEFITVDYKYSLKLELIFQSCNFFILGCILLMV